MTAPKVRAHSLPARYNRRLKSPEVQVRSPPSRSATLYGPGAQPLQLSFFYRECKHVSSVRTVFPSLPATLPFQPFSRAVREWDAPRKHTPLFGQNSPAKIQKEIQVHTSTTPRRKPGPATRLETRQSMPDLDTAELRAPLARSFLRRHSGARRPRWLSN